MFVLWVIRFFVFNLYESPKFLMGRGHDQAAVDVVHKVAAFNGKTSTLTLEHLRAAENQGTGLGKDGGDAEKMDTSAVAAAKRKLERFRMEHVKALFATRKLAWSTSLLITLWGEFCPLLFLSLNTERGD